MRYRLVLPAVLALGAGLGIPRTHADEKKEDPLAAQARAVLKKHCYRCHGIEERQPGLRVLEHKTLVEGKEPYVIAGKPDESPLWEAVDIGTMPLRSVKERPTKEEKETLKKWIAAGAPFFARPEERRTFVARKDVLRAIRDDLRALDREDRPHRRYFTFVNLHNNPTYTAEDLRLARAALSKAVNALSFEPTIVVPEALKDTRETVYAMDLRKIGWSLQRGDARPLWRELIIGYPYGLRYDESPDSELRKLDEEVFALAGGELPDVRADWFVTSATRPPLYHTLLRLPDHARELERRLGVDVVRNFRDDRLARAGFATSGISGQNRMVERHPSRLGAYWKSYDFKPDKPRTNLQRFPLGPVFPGNEFESVAFAHDGGEIIFTLPNGLHGYLLVDGKDRRIDAGPEDVVSDNSKVSGTSAIVNGLSCMACHAHGMKPLEDDVRKGTAVGGRARIKVQKLYLERKAMNDLLARDKEPFLTALDRAVGPFLKVGPDKDRALTAFKEPVGEVAARHRLNDLKLAEVAFELGMEKPETLLAAIKGNTRLRELGLATLPPGGSLKRADWERVGATSLYQRVARELDRGTPWQVLH